MAEQLRLSQRDATKVKLDVRLTTLKPHFCDWVAAALEQMAAKRDVIRRGWDESKMGRAFELISMGFSHARGSAEYQKAAALEATGGLFASFTSKKKATLAESLLAQHMEAHVAEGRHEKEGTGDLLGSDLDCLPEFVDSEFAEAFMRYAHGDDEESDEEGEEEEEEPLEVTAVLDALSTQGALASAAPIFP